MSDVSELTKQKGLIASITYLVLIFRPLLTSFDLINPFYVVNLFYAVIFICGATFFTIIFSQPRFVLLLFERTFDKTFSPFEIDFKSRYPHMTSVGFYDQAPEKIQKEIDKIDTYWFDNFKLYVSLLIFVPLLAIVTIIDLARILTKVSVWSLIQIFRIMNNFIAINAIFIVLGILVILATHNRLKKHISDFIELLRSVEYGESSIQN